jgi:hypothetical protein
MRVFLNALGSAFAENRKAGGRPNGEAGFGNPYPEYAMAIRTLNG